MVSTRWILAFDGSCSRCASISRRVDEAGGGKLTVRPLGDEQVAQWRQEAFDGTPPWAPTLLRVSGSGVRAWTGRPMAFALVRHLGLRSTLAVLRELGRYRDEERAELAETAGGMNRASFLKIGAGAAFAIGALGLGSAASAATAVSAQDWVRANADQLPKDLAEFAEFPVAYRRAIFAYLPPEQQARLWSEHLVRYRTTADLNQEQQAVLDRVMTEVEKGRVFRSNSAASTHAADELAREARAVFDDTHMRAAFYDLGGPDGVGHRALPRLADCACYLGQPAWCSCPGNCRSGSCTPSTQGCGFLYVYPCDGLCGPC